MIIISYWVLSIISAYKSDIPYIPYNPYNPYNP